MSVNEGKEDRVEELLMAVVKSANSDAEPGCKTYRFNRTADRRTVWMYEEYEDEAALKVRSFIDTVLAPWAHQFRLTDPDAPGAVCLPGAAEGQRE